MKNEELRTVFASLKSMLAKHAKGRVIVHDTDEHYYLNEAELDARGKPIYFGMVKIGSGKVAFHLMPVYTHPELVAEISPELKKRMQGKSCFNFDRANPTLFEEFEGVVNASASVAKVAK
jgi:hypothetical protein